MWAGTLGVKASGVRSSTARRTCATSGAFASVFRHAQQPHAAPQNAPARAPQHVWGPTTLWGSLGSRQSTACRALLQRQRRHEADG